MGEEWEPSMGMQGLPSAAEGAVGALSAPSAPLMVPPGLQPAPRRPHAMAPWGVFIPIAATCLFHSSVTG